MARGDLLLDLVRAGARGDQLLFRKALEALVSEERAKQHHVLADQLAAQLRYDTNNSVGAYKLSPARDTAFDSFYETVPVRRLDDLLLPPIVLAASRELIEEHRRSDLLRAHN